MRETHATAAAAGLADHAARALVCLTTALEWAWMYDEAAAALEEALRYALANDLDGYVQYLLGVRAGLRLERCEWDAALADADAALNRPNLIGVSVVGALVVRGRILGARGDPSALSILDTAAEQAYGTEELQRIGPVAVARAEHFLLRGDPGRAADEATRGLALATVEGSSVAHHRAGVPALASHRPQRWSRTDLDTTLAVDGR